MNRRLWRRILGGAAAFAVTLSTVAAADPRIDMQDAWRKGDLDRALEASQTVLEINPREYLALALQARVARIQGNRDLAEDAAKRAWAAASNGGQRHEAARMVALTLFEQGSFTQAQLWLRRAIQNAPSPRVRAATIAEFKKVRQRNPWQVQLSFSVNRSDNINAGSSEQTWDAYFFGSEDSGGIPFVLPILGQQRALSGTEYVYGLNLTRRIQPTGPWSTQISGGVLIKDVVLSDEAKQQAPDARSSDYALRQLTFGSSTSRINGRNKHDLHGELSYVEYGGNHLSTGLRFGYNHSRAISKGFAWRSGLSLSRTLREDRHISSSWRSEVSTGPLRRVGKSLWTADLSVFDVSSESNSIARDGWTLKTRWSRTEPLALGARLSAGLDYGITTYDVGFFGAADARRDERIRANVSVLFSELDLYGFSPNLELSHARTNSNVTLYTYDDTSVVVGIKSAF